MTIDGPGNPAVGAARHDEQDTVAHFRYDDGKKFTSKIGICSHLREPVSI